MSGPRNRDWKGKLGALDVARPQLVIPLDWNPNVISHYAAMLGMRFMWRKMPDGYWVWRLPDKPAEAST